MYAVYQIRLFFVCSYLDSDWLDSVGLDNDECDACVSLEAGEANTARAHVVLRHDAARAHHEQVRDGVCTCRSLIRRRSGAS